MSASPSCAPSDRLAEHTTHHSPLSISCVVSSSSRPPAARISILTPGQILLLDINNPGVLKPSNIQLQIQHNY